MSLQEELQGLMNNIPDQNLLGFIISEEALDDLCKELKKDGFKIIKNPKSLGWRKYSGKNHGTCYVVKGKK